MNSLATLMYRITKSLLSPCTGACERVKDLMQSPFERKWMQTSLPSTAKGMRRFFKRAASFISPSLSIIRSCGYTPWLNTASLPHPRRLALIPYRVRHISGVPNPFVLAYPPIPPLKSTTTLSLQFSEAPQTLIGPPTPRPLWQSCCRSVKTPEHVFGYNPSNTP